ncbi:MAG TPA: tetratricopeptide repeat protein [Candidatus Eisenbacteria bacterium]
MDRSAAIKKKAQQLVGKGDVDGALREYDKLFSGGDRDPYDFILVADLLAKRGAMQEAVSRYRQAVEEYTKAELSKNAIAVCKKILRISKEDLAIHRTLGDLYSKEGLYSDAQIHYLEFAEGSIRRQEHEPALDVLDQVLALSPDNAELSEKYVELATRADLPERGGKELLRRAARAQKAGRLEEASSLTERASTLAPALAPAPEHPPPTPTPAAEPEIVAVAGPLGGTAEPEPPGERPRGAIDPSVRELSRGAEMEPAAPVLEVETSTEPEPEATPPAHAAARATTSAAHEDLAAEYARSGHKEQAAEEYWRAGDAALRAGDLPRARVMLEALLQLLPGHESALRRLVEITADGGDTAAEARWRLDLAEVYLAHEEWDLARAEYLRCLEIDHDNERARMRIQRLDTLAQSGALGARGPINFDAIPDVKPLASVSVRDDAPVNTDSLVDLEEIIDEFKQGVSERISGEDHESHYDLGMAYMEMGLYDEAIGEFQVASKGTSDELKCLEMIALCFLEKNEPSAAARELAHALELPGHGPEETISIRYNLGVAHERLGNLDRALQHYEEVYLLNVDFLKVAQKVKELKQKLAQTGDRG